MVIRTSVVDRRYGGPATGGGHASAEQLLTDSPGARGGAHLRSGVGGVLGLLAGGRLLCEEGSHPVVPGAGNQGSDRRHRDRPGAVGRLPGPRAEHRGMAGWSRARAVRGWARVRDLGPRPHRAQLGRPDDPEGQPELVTSGPYHLGPTPHLLGHPGGDCRHRSSTGLAVVDRGGSCRHLLRLCRHRRGALLGRAVP